MKQILDEARKKGYGVGAYNVNNMEQIQAIMAAAKATQSPVIIQASRGALKYSNFTYLKHLMLAAVEENPEIPVAMHLDHGNSLDSVKQAIDLGFSSVMIDGSLMEDGKTPSDYDYNVKVTRSVVEYSHKFGVTVEGEIGRLGGIEDGVGSGSIHLTDPEQAGQFVKDTGLDALAIAIGTSHGAYKFKGASNLAFDVLKKVRELIDIPLVLHGASSVPKELIDRVNKYGGKMPGATGVPMADLQKSITMGVSKINVDTDGRLAVTAAIREVFATKPEKFDPRDYLGPARDSLTQIIIGKMKDFGTAGHAGDYKSMSLEDMKKYYK
ncbi:MAG: fructose-1,6-bisphosphate aldolase [Elusimicrobia bacterium RIFOXYB12_FULL_50_12]|nr:MAG: fructose-1,6-bisphosphate aldolase [Elusimicrobia bacterium RIFOXYA12_FULL_49_49]OGS10962.1 MAG: fructose-1,6-bisphosphate aldolase [Elusimicrobia bacterium RIFOXYB1_FULL_48_9]OGS16238.1 MAG: fructose-1,6-bisphosphate aldolase [Elusimicrobia bacterium RIFOXYA2_FULL_47_53]OGS26219.1 MAG: fructose-1,6-bisphosphate aldolase [Elusimicrobia bacterium RIFOXYB12_FULL_50_12]OGS31393.1 MAG: fructose-1,6-bisphosphate aldolase [Elusimicrobia bacterium RIFOXYB2_FULL_46_23]